MLLSSVAIVGSGAACSSSSDGGEGCPRALSLNRWAAAKAFFAKPRGAESGTASGATRGAAREPPVIAGPPPWASWHRCRVAYARNVSAIFPSHNASDIVEKLAAPGASQPGAPPTRAATTAASPLILLAPGSSGTASLFWASAMLNMSAKHGNDVYLRGGRCSRSVGDASYEPEALFTRGCGGGGCEFVGDWPVPVQMASLWVRAPRARFVMLDFDAAAWHATRLGFRRGYCARSPQLKDCKVPLAFSTDGRDKGLWGDVAVAAASVDQTVAAADALKAFLRCVIPAERLLWLSWRMPPPQLWARLSRFARVPLPSNLDVSEFPRDRNARNGKMCTFGRTSCRDMLACVLREPCAGCRATNKQARCEELSKRPGSFKVPRGAACSLDFQNPFDQ